VSIQFQPLRAGWRKGGVLLKGTTGNILSAAYVQGIGTGAQRAQSYGAPVTYASVPKTNVQGSSGGTRLAVDGNGVLYMPFIPVSAEDFEYYSFSSPYSGTVPTPTPKVTGLDYPGYDTQTGQNYSATYDPDNRGCAAAAAVDRMIVKEAILSVAKASLP